MKNRIIWCLQQVVGNFFDVIKVEFWSRILGVATVAVNELWSESCHKKP